MEDIIPMLMAPDDALSWQTVLLSLMMSFLAAVAIAVTYVHTHEGLSYSRSFVQSLVLGAIVAATLMLAIGNNLARGIGILGTLAIIRFRSTMKDPRDMMFIFSAVAVGIGMGVRAYAVGLVGTGVFTLTAFLLKYVGFGARQVYDGLVRFRLSADTDSDARITAVLEEYCSRWVLITLKETGQGEEVEHHYHVKLADPGRQAVFIKALDGIPGIKGVSFFLHDATAEM